MAETIRFCHCVFKERCDLMQNNLGLYIHIPFCGKKCPYCSFYSVPYSKATVDEYCEKLIESIFAYGKKYNSKTVDTIYLGGGTPSLLGTERIKNIVLAAKKAFNSNPIEVTIEVNPTSGTKLDYKILFEVGVNRVSIGMQSVNENELKNLKRNHSISTVKKLIEKIKNSGICNISLDLMCCIPEQTIDSLEKSIKFCAEMGVTHISSYMLKIEEGTPFFNQRQNLLLPDEDYERELYLFMCKKLEELGYHQYEISNFSKSGFESRHNLKYWNCDDYLGIGPAAHSLVDFKRFFYNNSLQDFYNNKIVFESLGGDEEEFIMLRLRLKEGVNNDLYYNRFGKNLPKEYLERGKKLSSLGLTKVEENSISLTTEGFLLSNTVIAKILWG